jgi:hypothetical protein
MCLSTFDGRISIRIAVSPGSQGDGPGDRVILSGFDAVSARTPLWGPWGELYLTFALRPEALLSLFCQAGFDVGMSSFKKKRNKNPADCRVYPGRGCTHALSGLA